MSGSGKTKQQSLHAFFAKSSYPKTVQQETKTNSQSDCLKPNYGLELVGQRIQVYWEDDDAWYNGTVSKFNNKDGKHQVDYDDGDIEWLALREEKFELLNPRQQSVQQYRAKAHTKDLPTEPEDPKVDNSYMGTNKRYKNANFHKRPRKTLVYSSSDEDNDGEGTRKDPSFQAGEPSQSDASEVELEDDDDIPLTNKRKRRSPPQATATNRTGHQLQPTPATHLPTTTPTSANASERFAFRPPQTQSTNPGSEIGASVQIFASDCGQNTPASVTPLPRKLPAALSGLNRHVGVGDRQVDPSPQIQGREKFQTPSSMKMGAGIDDGELTGSGPTPVLGVGSNLTGEAQRYISFTVKKYPFLAQERIMDKNRRRPGDPLYDPRSLHVPSEIVKKLPEAQQQWWEFKAENFDSVLLFKVGKFYEMFDMDSHIGAETLGLVYMKGDRPHAGFPEAIYHQQAEKLARAHHRVVVVEQTETPEQLEKRNRERKGGKKINVVMRQKVAVLTVGTLLDPEMTAASEGESWVMTVVDLPLPPTAGSNAEVAIGVCLADVSTGRVVVGGFRDGALRTELRRVVNAYRPVEVILPIGDACTLDTAGLSSPSRAAIKSGLPNSRVVQLQPLRGFPAASEAGKRVRMALSTASEGRTQSPSPDNPLLVVAANSQAKPAEAMAAAAMIEFLDDALLAHVVLPTARVEWLDPPDVHQQASSPTEPHGPLPTIRVDAAALNNLEVIYTTLNTPQGSLLSAIDNCCTPFGRRRLKSWVCRPLARVQDIVTRQDAVQLLMSNYDGYTEALAAQLRKVRDIERSVSRLCSGAVGTGRDAPHVVLYENVGRRKVKALKDALTDLQTLHQALSAFAEALPSDAPKLLRELLPREGLTQLQTAVRDMLDATDWDEAAATGQIEPKKGVDESFDAIVSQVAAMEVAKDAVVKQAQKTIQSNKVTLVQKNKDQVLLVPDSLVDRVPAHFTLAGTKKGYNMYTSDELQQALRQLADAREEQDLAMTGILMTMHARFADHRATWLAAVDAAAQLDCLLSLATYAATFPSDICRPTFETSPQLPATFQAKSLGHPLGAHVASRGQFVSNDVTLGADDSPRFVLLTGPNMGGKSTVLRQVCCAALLAHVGAWVPAKSLVLSPVDAIFVRMGAQDRILARESTFYVELAETAAMLQGATERSLVALDELGRGTATMDGTAIASAVCQHMATRVRPRVLFATHYHRLSSEAEEGSLKGLIAPMHMACQVSKPSDGSDIEDIVFLYRLACGACPKSYGGHVAKLAGLPPKVVARAQEMSYTFEDYCQTMQETTGKWLANSMQSVKAQEQAPSQHALAKHIMPDDANDYVSQECLEQLRNVWAKVQGLQRASNCGLA